MTQKRIKAYKETFIGSDNVTYTIHQRDIRALAEQLIAGIDECYRKLPYDMALPDAKLKALLYALKRAGITPGRKERAK